MSAVFQKYPSKIIELRQEAIRLTDELSGIFTSFLGTFEDEVNLWDDFKVIRYALLTRQGKMLRRIAKAWESGDREAVEIFSRCAFETFATYCDLQAGGEARYQQFREAGHQSEAKLRKALKSRHQASPTQDPLEMVVRKELDALWERNAFPEKRQDFKPKESLVGKGRMDELQWIYLWNEPSQAVHGTYTNLVNQHLTVSFPWKVKPRLGNCRPSGHLPISIALMSSEMIESFLHSSKVAAQEHWVRLVGAFRERMKAIQQAADGHSI